MYFVLLLGFTKCQKFTLFLRKILWKKSCYKEIKDFLQLWAGNHGVETWGKRL